MAYMSQEMKQQIAPNVKKVLAKYGMKGTLSVNNRSTLVLTLTSGKFDFSNIFGLNGNSIAYYKNNINEKPKNYPKNFPEFFNEIHAAMNDGNWDNSNAQIDYFDVGWYVEINIGKYNKPYVFNQ